MVTIRQNIVPTNVMAMTTTAGKNSDTYITIHETANTAAGANAAAHARLQFNGNSRAASWHYSVDEKEAIQSYPDGKICWHAGAKYPRVSGNPRSIGVEICVNSDGNYRKAVENAAEVVAHLMKKHGIPIDRVVQHNHWSGKDCPKQMRAGRDGITWTTFKQMVLRAHSGGSVASVTETRKLPYVAVLDIGVKGAAVKRYQSDMNKIGNYGLEVDGIYGEASKGATVKFQKEHGLYVDGIAGYDTQTKLAKLLVDKANIPPVNTTTPSTSDKETGEMELFTTNSKAIMDAVTSVLKRMEADDKPLSDKWRKRLELGTLTNSDAIGLLFVAIERGYFTQSNDTEEK